MMKYYFFLFFCLLAIRGSSQENYNKDSLYKIIISQKQDTNLVKAYILFGELIEDNYVDSAILFMDKGFTLSNQLQWQLGIITYYRKISMLLAKKGEYEKATQLAIKGLQRTEKYGDKKNIAAIYGTLGNIYGMQNLDDRSSSYYLKSLEIFNSLKDTLEITSLYCNASTVYYNQGQYDKAIQFANNALPFILKIKDTFLIAQLYINLSNSYSFLEDSVQELSFIRKAVTVTGPTNNSFLKMLVYSHFGKWLIENDKADSGIIMTRISLILSQKNNFIEEEFCNLSQLAWGYQQLGNLSAALLSITLAEKKLQRKGISPIAKSFYYSILTDIEKDRGNYKAALLATEQMNNINDSITNKSTKIALDVFNSRIKEIEEENKFLKKEVQIKNQRNWIIGLSLSSIALLGTTIFYLLYAQKKQQLKNKKIVSLQQEKEFISVKSSLEGQLQERSRISKEIHDELGSSLTSISLLTEVLKKRIDTSLNPEVNRISDTSADMVDKMNEIIWALNTSNDTISSLIAYVRKFATNFLQEANIELVFLENAIPDHIPIEGTVRRNIYLTLKEAIHNIVKHSSAQKVNIQVAVTDHLTIEVKDDGKGINFDQLSIFGNGLTNMKKRIEDIGGTFSIENNNGTLIKLTY
jgi:signal transduction histidine kinase